VINVLPTVLVEGFAERSVLPLYSRGTLCGAVRRATACASRENVLKMEVVSTGYLNAVCFWFDLHLDEEESLTSAPRGIGKGGQIVGELKREDTATVQAQINASMARFKATLAANPRTDLGAMVRLRPRLHAATRYGAQRGFTSQADTTRSRLRLRRRQLNAPN